MIVPKITSDSNYASIIISDNGTGIPQEKIKEINNGDYFYNPINQKHGLGLIIVKSIAQAYKEKFII